MGATITKKLYKIRPFTYQFNRFVRRHRVRAGPEIPDNEWLFAKGDVVEILHGKNKGRHGIVTDILRTYNQVTISGFNLQRRLLPKPKDEKAVHISHINLNWPYYARQIALVDPLTGKACEAINKCIQDPESGQVKRVRISLDTGAVIDFPQAEEKPLEPGMKDTLMGEVKEKTYMPDFTKRPMPMDCTINANIITVND
ncbi:Ribosomal protein L24/L26 domain-containing protein [Rozella allomycis CSF55]|uniref:Ribosomal protein L24/L26 domain-containing protein n=1 Tax=Rozella allomycis (strain CSF55) TaxID=988480 RepID=A0A075B4D4_ROZAC|nr:Ribosomal protein L24/L26 domain-containing protein [Rozella allomycis CSF55]|eukprot:EPZ36067.1 Ribosomal protein L24/L26 domain-containing protein [Rozella allomycis CSF55]